jgi:hypothetical protein
MEEQSNEERIKNGLGWERIGRNNTQNIYQLRERVNVWGKNPDDKILKFEDIETTDLFYKVVKVFPKTLENLEDGKE